MTSYDHMPWCPDHDHPYSCELEQSITNALTVVLTAGQCDSGSVHLEVQGAATSAAELAALVAALQEFAGPVAVAEAETECVGHNHDEDDEPAAEDDEDEDPIPCDGCGTTDYESRWLVPDRGYLGISCGCLTAAGYRESEDGTKLERI